MKAEANIEDVFEVTKRKLQNPGLLLTSVNLNGHYNVMTIGYGLLGRFWKETIFMVAISPRKYTFQLIEETNEFTVNIPADDMDEVVAYCGEVSGRDHDKFNETKLTVIDGKRVKSPIIDRCIVHFECKVIGKAQVVPELLSSDVQKTCYQSGYYHTLYFGKIVSILINK